ncbi:hypothetical protein K402DRAFT_376330 [Aulographum hederae CBS 113979]|uniref:FAD-binding FR-type domain-containing protein n=1 Tax=Aulographum hederae CBS 113979 TaxID=1176131 RepID=A0A6G1H207_9PEZI|nr:hypothetical protein K402DRAFT_376330 [Aulographum hederae CBS 113979]
MTRVQPTSRLTAAPPSYLIFTFSVDLIEYIPMEKSYEDSKWLRNALRAALSTGYQSTPGSFAPTIQDGPQHRPGFRKLIEALEFSRWFILTYHAALVTILLFVAAVHWGDKIKKHRGRKLLARIHHDGVPSMERLRIKSQEEGEFHVSVDSGQSSESSSTLSGNATPPDVKSDPHEESSLLGRKKRLWRPSLASYVKSWLMYQPRPLPFIHKTLPDNGTSLLVLCFFGLNIFYTLFKTSFNVFGLFSFADRCGLLFAANFPLLYLFAAKNQPIKRLTGYSYESLNKFHRRLGEMMCLLGFMHAVAMVGVWNYLLRPSGVTFSHFLAIRMISLGFVTLFCYEMIYFTSLATIRQRYYELFLASHVFLQVAALVFLFLHHHGSRPYVLVSLVIYIVDRLVFRMAVKVTTMPADLTILPDGETVMVSANWSIPSPSSFISPRSSIIHGWKPTDHVFLTLPSLSHFHRFQAHPFTIASTAPSTEAPSTDPESTRTQPHAWLNLLIRSRSGFSADLLTYARTHPRTPIRLDGPYGSSHCIDMLLDCDTSIIIAGGSGIAVAFPLAWAVANDPLRSQRRAKITLIWIVHTRSHFSWLPEERLSELRDLGVEVVLEDPTDERGRPDVKRMVRDVAEREAVEGKSERCRTGVVVSGPGGMDRDVRNSCAGVVRNGMDVRVRVEKFGW